MTSREVNWFEVTWLINGGLMMIPGQRDLEPSILVTLLQCLSDVQYGTVGFAPLDLSLMEGGITFNSGLNTERIVLSERDIPVHRGF